MNPLFRSVHAVMARRILVNFRIRPEVAVPLLPAPFRPRLVHGWALAGICLIRLTDLRPAWLPRLCGLSSENAAHRLAVEWTGQGETHEGVFIPRRDTNSWINQLAGGRLFPGIHHRAQFQCAQGGSSFDVELHRQDGSAHGHVLARLADAWPADSVFASLAQAVAFFQSGGCGWSPTRDRHAVEGVELCASDWTMLPLAVECAESSFFADPRRFPRGSVELDSALLMSGIAHEWRARGPLDPGPAASPGRHHRLAAHFEMT
jgi:hypothetical protein